MTELIRRINQLEVGLEKIKDRETRLAFSGLIDLVRSFQGEGFYTTGTVFANALDLDDGAITSVGGTLNIDRLNIADGGSFKVATAKNVISGVSRDYVDIIGEIYGVIGWTTNDAADYTGGASNGEPKWYEMSSTIITSGIYWSHGSVSSAYGTTTNRVDLANGSSNDHKYRLVIFYKPEEGQ